MADTLVVSTPELAKKILLNWRTYEKQSAAVTPHAKYVLGENVVFANSETWKLQRSIMNPAFYNVDRFATDFSKKTKECMDGIAKCLHGNVLNIPSFMTAFTLDVLGSSAFGYEFNYMNELVNKELGKPVNENKLEVIEAYDFMINNLFSLVTVLGGKAYANLPLEFNKKFFNSTKKVENLIYKIINDTKKRQLRGETTTLERTETLLDMLVSSVDDETKQGMDEKALRDNVIIFFIAGHDTTSTALCYALYSLGKFPDVQDKVIQEISDKVGLDANKDVTVDDIEQLEYLTMFIKENLRVFPPVPSVTGRIVNSTEVLGDYTIAKGRKVGISIYNIHHNPQVWGPDVDQFRPERFSEHESTGRHSHAFLPFGAGPRTCVGQR
jgi:cytochrome P450 family 4 subfamily B polypeptide 1